MKNLLSVDIAVILPAYNEELTIEKSIIKFNKELPNAAIWVINNNSSDNTESIATNVLKRLNCKGGVINELRKGKGNAVRKAFDFIQADYYLLCDSDLTYPINRSSDLLLPLVNNKADMVVGDRHTLGQYANKNKRIFHSFGNSLVRILVNKLFDANLIDIMSGFRSFNRRFVKNYPILIDGFEIETDMTIHALDKRLMVLEIPIDYNDRPSGSVSKLNTFSDGSKVIFTIFRILRYYRPLLFFGSLSIIFSIGGLIAGFPVIFEWMQYRYINHVPLAILSSGLGVIAFMLLGIGLILDAISYNEKAAFERHNIKN